MNKLKPCPFCGSKASKTSSPLQMICFIKCKKKSCSAELGHFKFYSLKNDESFPKDGWEKASKKWNTRV